MEDNRVEQKEALEVLTEFNDRLLKNMKIIVKELSGKRLDDTDIFLQEIVKAINWEVQVMNGTMGMLNEEKQRIDKDEFNSKMILLSDAIGEKNDGKIADAMASIIPSFEGLGNAAREAIA